MLSFAPSHASAAAKGGSFTVGNKTFLLNGHPFIVKAAELHYPRIPRPYWEHRIKMCKALGMNTICLYVFWNIHEQREGQFDFTGNNDVAAFCRLAQKNGMYVIVRPGPYVCAEWEMGGLPWWLLKKKDIRLRENDPYFIERVRLFEHEVGKQLSGLTIQNGGPIIMVQVENEYGSYGEDKEYVSKIRDIVKESGFDKVTLFQCDWASNFTKNGLDDLVWTMNFGTGANIDAQFKKLGKLRPNSPKMCSEFWSGWFDKWGARHETRPAKAMVEGMDEMLSKNISFSLYMTHGGTSFGHWAGANSPGFAPDVTSYDYDAPINEYGQATPKFFELRDMMAKHNDGKPLPDIPKPAAKLVSFPKVRLTEYAELLAGATKCEAGELKTFEDMDMGWGSMTYSARLPRIAKRSVLKVEGGHDYVQVFINGKYIGKIDRVKHETSINLPPVEKDDVLTLEVEAMGRINFGRAIKDYKGLTGKVTINVDNRSDDITYNLKRWIQVTIPDDYDNAIAALEEQKKLDQTERADSGVIYIKGVKVPAAIRTAAPNTHKRGYYRGYFHLKKVGDTFINMESWGKGQVYVNGHAIGRFWSIGPQQTLYMPGCWLKKGKNEIVVLDVVGPNKPELFGQATPELDKLNLTGKTLHRKPGETFDTSKLNMIYAGSFSKGNGWQTVNFGRENKGRYLVIECLNAHDGGNVASIAELYALSKDGKRLSREPWTVRYADSEDADNGNKTADKVFDLQESTYWSTVKGVKFPHVIVIDLGEEQDITGIEYLPRAEQGAPESVKDYRIYLY